MKILHKLTFLFILMFLYVGNTFANINLNVSPIKYEIDTSTGSVITKVATLFNRSNQTHTIYTGKSDFESQDNTGNPSFVRKSELVYEDQQLSTWIDISTENFVILPGEKKEIEFTITVPSNATPGGHYGAVFFKNNNSENSSGSKVNINVDYGVLLLVNVDGEIITDGDVEDTIITNNGGGSDSGGGGTKSGSSNGGDGWGGGASITKIDNCPIIDLTNSNYDGKCVDNIISDFFNTDENIEENIKDLNLEDISKTDIDVLDDEIDDLDDEIDTFNIKFDTLFVNEGNIHLKPTGQIKLVDEDGNEIKGIGKEVIKNDEGAIIGEKIVDYLPINDNGGNVLPNTKRNFESEWKGFPYEAYDETGAKVIKYWTPEEYYTKKNVEENRFIMPWERINERINYEKINANIDVEYIDKDGETVEFTSAKEFNVEYKEKYIGLNPYVFIFGGFILFFLFFFWFILLKRKRKKCIECRKIIKKDMKICPYCGTKQDNNIDTKTKKREKKKVTKKKTKKKS